MTKIGVIRFIVVLTFFCAFATHAQKVKYKDLFGLLSTKQYEQAEPFLKRYLKDNTDNPNAFLFMGIIFQEKANKIDILKQTTLAIANMDSAILFYDKAYATITEKELKRNDEYYQAYNRRDLRTGEFGVKLSDVQFDLEKKKEGLRERIDKVKMVKYYFILADSLYKKSNVLFRSIQDAFPGEKEFFLRANEKTLADLSKLAIRFDSCTRAFDAYKSSSSLLGKTGYNQVLTLNDITNFKKDGATTANFYQDDVQIWNYKKFADAAKLTIEKEVLPMQNSLVRYDIEINKLREKLNHDSISVKSDLTKLIDQLLLNQLRKFDPEPLPMEVFALKVADLEYRSALLEDKPLRDSADLKLQVGLTTKEIRYLDKLDSIATKLTAKDIDEEVENYNNFITSTFSNSIVLKSYIKSLKEYAEREKRKEDDKLRYNNESLKWLVNAGDSIPLITGVSRSRFKPLVTIDDKYTAGLAYTDSLTMNGYFYNIPYSHVPKIKAAFPVDKANFRLSKLPYTKAITFTDGGEQIFFILIYSEKNTKDNKYPATLAKVYKSDGLAWNNNYSLPFLPKEVSFKSDTGELTIKGETQQSIVDKNGKLMK